jgi:hypothetical protein
MWTDEEVVLLLSVVSDYKSTKAAEGVDWSSVKTKSEDLVAKFKERYPKTTSSHFPHTGDVFNKERLWSKLKRIRTGYKKALDSGRRSGGGRIVTTFFDECSEIWGVSPAVECVKNGIESSRQDVVEDLVEDVDALAAANNSSLPSNNVDSVDEELDESIENESNHDEGRRSFLTFLNNKRDAKLSKKIATESQLLAIAKEELSLKRKATEKMEESEKKYQKTMDSFATGLTNVTSTITKGFTLLGNLLKDNQEQTATPYCTHGEIHAFQQPYLVLISLICSKILRALHNQLVQLD